MINIKTFVFSPFMENTYVLYDNNKKAIVVDPGCYEQYEKQQLDNFIVSEGLQVQLLINTHCHIDHVFGNYYVKEKYNVPLHIHEKDLETLRSVKAYAPSYGFQHYEEAAPDGFLNEGKDVEAGEMIFEVRFTPGHAPGHVVLINKEENICIGGDVLFQGSIGRTDLPGGDLNTLIKSIHEKLFNDLPDDMVVYPGHGPETTIGVEKRTNPFCAVNK